MLRLPAQLTTGVAAHVLGAVEPITTVRGPAKPRMQQGRERIRVGSDKGVRAALDSSPHLVLDGHPTIVEHQPNGHWQDRGMRVVLLDFDGTCYVGDLPVQAYARRVAELLDSDAAATVIGGMRAFAEGKPKPAGMPAEFDIAEDGYELVTALANQAGLSTAERRAAYLRSREDVARSAFAIDAEPGLVDWLVALRDADADAHTQVWLATLGPLVGMSEVLDSTGLLPLIDRLLPGTPKPDGIAALAAAALELTGDPENVLGIGDRWAADLAGVAAAGGRTAHLDRYGRQLGAPTWRGRELSELLPALHAWAGTVQEVEGARHAG